MGNRDETFERAMKFVKNSQEIHPGISNIYVFTSVDSDGNIVDEKYGMNLMTNIGFRSIYQDNNAFEASNTVKLYVGADVSQQGVRPTDTRLEHPCFNGLAATNTVTAKDYTYPMYYAPGDGPNQGLITLISKFMTCEYAENIDGFPDQTRIDDYGIGTSASNLWTHSRTYAMDGSLASVFKNPNEKLIINVYMCLSFYEHVITNGWANDVYTMITTNQVMYHRMFESNLKTYKRNNVVHNRTTFNYNDGYHSLENATSDVYENTTICPPFTIYDNYTTDSGYIDGFIYQTDGMIILEPQKLDTPESVTITNLQSNDPTNKEGFANKFGMYPTTTSEYNKHQWPSITRLNTASVYIFDWKTGDWHNQLSIYNPGGRSYTETPAQTSCGLPLIYYNMGSYIQGYVFQNIRPEDPILKVTGGGLTVYATDKYWDKSTWVNVQDFNNIPVEIQSKRYWITNNNVDKLDFVRQSDVFQLLEKGGSTPADNGFYDYGGFNKEYGAAAQCDNYQYGWYMRDNKVYATSTQTTYTIGNESNTESMTYGKWLVTFNSVNNSIIVTDMSQLSSSIVNPVNTAVGFSGNVNSYSGCYRTQSETGVICMQSTTSGVQECAIIDLRDTSEVRITIKPWKMSCCIWGTNKIAYVPVGTDAVYIYDVQTQSIDGDPIPFPDNIPSIPFMFGHTKYVWFTDGATHAHVVDISLPTGRTPVGYVNNIPYNTDLHNIKITALDDVFIVYDKSEYGNNEIAKAHYILLSNPSNPVSLSDFEYNGSYNKNRIDYILRYVQRSSNGGIEHGSIALIISRTWDNSSSNKSGASDQVIDFGQYLTNNEVHRLIFRDYNIAGILLYGENIIWGTNRKCPIINFMPIRIVGTSDTITSFNTIKNVSGKKYVVSYTNIPTWGDGTINPNGVPPGRPLAETDGTGAITRWSD